MKKYKLRNGKVVVIREGKREDAKAVITYMEKVSGESDYLTFGDGEFNTTVEEEAIFIEDSKKYRNALFLIAVCEDEIIGCLTFSGGNRKRIEHYGEFGITVLRKYWGFGIGKILINYLINWARETGIIKKINLKVRADNIKAIKLYKRLGFIMEGAISRFFYHNGIFYDVYIMGIEID